MIREHLAHNRQMVFLMGPRQVGKTTTARAIARAHGDHLYLDHDNRDHRRVLLSGPGAVAEVLELDRLREKPPLLVLDELHKYGRWKEFLKGFFDTYEDRVRILVTGSARLDVYRAGGDSLMGRYFSYRMHPLSVAELATSHRAPGLLAPPRVLEDARFETLLRFGGYPEPFLKGKQRFWRRWHRTRTEQLFREDLRDLTRVRELGQVEVLAELIRLRCGQLCSTASLASEIGASVDSVRRWLQTLEALFYCFSIRPWHRNVARALRKEPKYYLWDFSGVSGEGPRFENLVASALLKAAHFWEDRGDGRFELHFLRDKQKHEVDFLMVRDDEPWFLVEAKCAGSRRLSPHLKRFQEQLGVRHAFQVARDLPPVDRDCFETEGPLIVPARTFLSQLV